MIRLKRLLACSIDGCLIELFISLVIKCYILIVGNYNNVIFSYVVEIVSLVLLIVFFICKDCLFKNTSIGKKVFKLAIYNNQGQIVTSKELLIKRNAYTALLCFMYAWTVLFHGQSIGDKITNTYVSKKI